MAEIEGLGVKSESWKSIAVDSSIVLRDRMGGRFIMLFCEVFLSHRLFCLEADVDRPLFSLGQINGAQSLSGRFIEALEGAG